MYLALAGVLLAWVFYVKRPDLPEKVAKMFAPLYTLFVNKYYADDFNQKVFAGGSVGLGKILWKAATALIDGLAVNGSARLIGWLSSILRHVQTGFLYHYAFTMIIGLAVLLGCICGGTLTLRLPNGQKSNSMQLDWSILSVLIWLPIAGGVALLSLAIAPSNRPLGRVGGVVATFALSIPLYTHFDASSAHAICGAR